MSTIFNEKSELENIDQKFTLFYQKSHRLSELKLSFYNKMEIARNNATQKDKTQTEINKHIHDVQTYYVALIRTSNLSRIVYHKMTEVVKDSIDKIQIPTLYDRSEELKQYNYKTGEKESIIDIVNQKNILQLQKNMIEFLAQVKQTLENILKKNTANLKLIEEKILEEQIILNKIKNPHQIIEEIQLEANVHTLFELENKMEEEINHEIQSLLFLSRKFLGNDCETLKTDIKSMLNIYEDIKQNLSGPYNFLVGKGKILEKNASIFAAIVVGLSGVSAIAALAGFTTAVGIFSVAFSVVATGGEALQALPIIDRKILPRINDNITQIIKNNEKAKQELANTLNLKAA